MEDERLVSFPASDALLLSTLYAIGRLVEVHVKDGSVYSGVFHTASVDEGYGVVLKKARMIEKGKCYSNLNAGALVDTLVVLAIDLVQVVVKDFLLTGEGSICHSTCDFPQEVVNFADLQNTDAASSENQEQEDLSLSGTDDVLEVRDLTKSPKSLKHDCEAFEGRPSARCSDEVEEQSLMPVASAQARESELLLLQVNSRSQTDTTNTVVCEAYRSCPIFVCPLEANAIRENPDDQKSRNQETSGFVCLPTSPGTKCTSRMSAEAPSSVAQTSTPSTSSSLVSIDNSSAFPELSASLKFPAIKGNSFCNTFAKGFKLNPEAKVFVPSFMGSRSTSAVNLHVVNTSNIANIPPLMPVVAAHSNPEISSFPSFTPLPTKFVQYDPLVAGQTGICTRIPRPVLGQSYGRQQPVRYSGPYHPSVQAGNIYMHQNIQPVMVGRASQLVYVHPLSQAQDPIQGTAILSQGFSAMTPCQAIMPKVEGVPTQSLPFNVTLPVVAAPMRPYTSSMPFANVRPIAIPSGNGFISSKFH